MMFKRFAAALLALLISNAIAQVTNPSGSGYDDLDGDVINYEYVDFGAFHLYMSDNKLKWRGKGGAFDSVVAQVIPQVSKVDDGIFFMSWPTVEQRGDNVILNFNDMTVFAHLGGGESFNLIHGSIQCRNSNDCIAPEGEIMKGPEIGGKIMANTKASGKPGPTEALTKGENLSAADAAGKALLLGKVLKYRTAEGIVSVQVIGDETLVSENGGEAVAHATHATQITDGIYFISWGGEHSGNHIAFNSHTMKIFDQIMADGTRVEGIYEASCFDNLDSC